MNSAVVTIDCDYLSRQFAAAFLRVTPSGEAAFIENNTVHAVPILLKAMSEAGVRPEQIRYLIITHVHLDHAGGTAALLKHCPQATVLAHPRAAKHLIDPAKLVASAQAVYGVDRFKEVYGQIEPVSESRVRIMEDGSQAPLGNSALHFLHTRGHAKHHFVVHDPDADTVFTGDAFGLCYPSLQRAQQFIFPSTSPTDFEPEEALKSIDRILSLGTSRAHLTHFGPIQELRRAAEQLRPQIEFSRSVVEKYRGQALPFEELARRIEPELKLELDRAMRASGLTPTAEDWDRLALDLEVNAQGLAWVALKQP